jgi:uncharacterized protein
MKIGVISDTHGDLQAWNNVMEKLFFDCDRIIHAGDVLYHGPRNPIVSGYNPGELAKKINELKVPLIIAKGNCDAEVDQMVINQPIMSPYVFLSINEKNILVCHGHNYEATDLPQIAKNYGAQIIIFGHSHIHQLTQVDGVILLHPGSPSLPKGEGRATVAIIENNSIKIINCNNQETISEITLM